MVTDIMLHVQNGHCPRCKRETDARYALQLHEGKPATLKPSDAHSAHCALCWADIGAQIKDATRILRYPRSQETKGGLP